MMAFRGGINVNTKYDWNQAERFFMDAEGPGRISLKGVSEQFTIPYQTVRRHAAAHDWHSRRYRDWIKREHGIEFEEHLAALHNDIVSKD